MTHDSIESNVRSRRLDGGTEAISSESSKPNSVNANNNNDYSNGSASIRREHGTAECRLSLMNAPPYNNEPFIPQIRWPDLVAQLFLHVGAVYALVFHMYAIKFYTLIWCK